MSAKKILATLVVAGFSLAGLANEDFYRAVERGDYARALKVLEVDRTVRLCWVPHKQAPSVFRLVENSQDELALRLRDAMYEFVQSSSESSSTQVDTRVPRVSPTIKVRTGQGVVEIASQMPEATRKIFLFGVWFGQQSK